MSHLPNRLNRIESPVSDDLDITTYDVVPRGGNKTSPHNEMTLKQIKKIRVTLLFSIFGCCISKISHLWMLYFRNISFLDAVFPKDRYQIYL